MKKSVFLFVFVGMVGLLTGCKNFLNSQSFLDELESSISYSKASYADVTISVASSATEYISPAAGNYNKNYKVSDHLELNFTPKSNFQFAKWIATPADSVSFDNAENEKTTATILSAAEPITIEPLVFERPEITVAPGNAVENPRNTAIVISFSEPMSLTEENLKEIAITVDDISVLENFEEPVFDETCTRITFIPKRDNLIDVPSGAKVVKVTIPETFYYEKEGIKVYLNQEFNYSFKINSTTETSLEISVNCSSVQADLSYSGTKVYYLDNEFKVKCTPKTGYSFMGWGATYNDDDSLVEESILEYTVSEDGTEATVKILTGSSRSISFFPVLIDQGTVTVSFSTAHGYVTPTDTKLYYVGDEFNVSYREEQGFVFTGWQVEDASGEIVYDVIEIKNANAAETKCKILKEAAGVKLVAKTNSRPAVVNISPNYTGESTFRDSRITVLFGEKMSEKAIYWTKDELAAENITEDKYDYIECKDRTYAAGKKYIYAYKEKGDTEGNTLKFRNIEISELNKGTNFLKHYDEPFYESTNNTMLIIPAKMPENGQERCVPASNFVKVTVKSSFCSYNMIPTNNEKNGYFFTNKDTDKQAPTVTIEHLKINQSDDLGDEGSDTFNRSDPNLASNKLSLELKGTISDDGSKPSSLQVKLTPKDGICQYQHKQEYIETITLTPDGNGTCNYKNDPLKIDIDLKDKYEGAYDISFICYDNRNNKSLESVKYGFIYDDKVNANSNFGVNCPIRSFTSAGAAIAQLRVMSSPNCEFNISFGDDNDIWYPTENVINLIEIWKERGIKLSKEKDSLDMLIKVRDAFNEYSKTYPNYFTYDWRSQLKVEAFVVQGRGTYITYTLSMGEDCKDVKYLYTNIHNASSSTACPITGMDIVRKNITFSYKDGTSSIGFEAIKPDSNGQISFNTLFRGLDGTKTIVGTVQFEDSDGNKTKVFDINIVK